VHEGREIEPELFDIALIEDDPGVIAPLDPSVGGRAGAQLREVEVNG